MPGYFEGDVTIEAVRELGRGVELRVRRVGGDLDEAVLSADDFARLLTKQPPPAAGIAPVSPGR